MIDLANYKRSIQWLKSGIEAQSREPQDEMFRDGLLQSFQVTYNVTESVLRQALCELSDDRLIPYLSSGELMRFAADEGLSLTSSEQWLRYGLAIEEANGTGDEVSSKAALPDLANYAHDLETFAERLGQRLVTHV